MAKVGFLGGRDWGAAAMAMRFCIWGCGIRGKNVFRFLGREHICAFIDRNPDLQGSDYENVPVISFETYLRTYRDCIVIVTPHYGHEKILRDLKEANVEALSALLLPPEILETPQPELLCVIDRKTGNGPLFLYGLNLFSILLLNHYHPVRPVRLIAEQGAAMWLKRWIVENFPGSLGNLDEVGENTLYITGGVYWNDEIPVKKKAGLYDFLYDIEAYHNPQIEKLKGIHAGKRCFIIGTGPSLRIADLDRLRESGDICISMNGIILAYDDTAWRPDYYLIEDRVGWKTWKDALMGQYGIEHMLISDVCMGETEQPGFLRFHLAYLNISPQCPPLFSRDFSQGAYVSGTVTYACLQLAVYLGCTEIYLYGIDFNYADPQGHFTEAYVPVKLSEDLYEQNRARFGFQSAWREARKLGIHIYNASRRTALDVFESVDFDSLFAGGPI